MASYHAEMVNIKGNEMLTKGIIVSIQGYSLELTKEIAQEVINAGASAIKTDKPIKKYIQSDIQIIGCSKMRVRNPELEPYLTSTVQLIHDVAEWSDYVSIDYRKLNKDVKLLSNYCEENHIKVIADIGDMEDYENMKNLYYDYIATTFTVFNPKFRFYPHIEFALELHEKEKNIIAEGNYKERKHVREMYRSGINHICIGGAITNIYKLTRKFTTVMKNDISS